MMEIKAYPIGQDLLCQLDSDLDQSMNKKRREMTRVPVLVLDCYRPREGWIHRCLDSWTESLNQLGFNEDTEAHIIEFESRVTVKKVRIKELGGYKNDSHGWTSMTPVVEHLKDVIKTNMENDIYLWVVSDGQIGDQGRFREVFKQHMINFMNSGNISVSGIRSTCENGCPDTTAMCAVGQLADNKFKLKVFAVQNYRFSYDHGPVQDLINLMKSISATEGRLTLETEGNQKRLAKKPGEELSSSVQIRNRDYVLIRKPYGKLTLNGTPLSIEERPEQESLKILQRYAHIALQELGHKKITAVTDHTDYFIQALERFFKELEAEEASIEEGTTKTGSTKYRAHLLKRSLGKQKRGILLQIAQLRNKNKMVQLSRNAQASFLRGLCMESKSNKALNKKYISTQTDTDKMIQDAVNIFVNKVKEIKETSENPEMPRCFVLQETSLESCSTALNAAIEIFNDYGNLDAENCLQLLGLIGIAIAHTIDNYVEPMNLGLNQGFQDKIKTIYPGVVLNQTSLWFAAKNSQILRAPGFSGEITGVVPIKKWNHPLVWNLYNSLTSIAVLQCSAQLRRKLTPLPRDRRALATSALLKMVSIWPDPSEIQATTMADMLDSIQMLNIPKKMANLTSLLTGDRNTDLHFTNANALNSELAPFALMMVDGKLLSFAGSSDSKQFWRALISNTTHWRTQKALGEEDRQEELRKLFSINEKHNTKVLPDDVEEPEEPVIYCRWNVEEMEEYTRKKKLRPCYPIFLKLHAIAKIYNSTGRIGTQMFKAEATPKEEFEKFVIGYDYNTFMELEVAKAVKMKAESDRFRKEGNTTLALRVAHPNTRDQARKCLEDMVRPTYHKEYMRQLGEKRKRVTEEARTAFLDEFATMSLDDFSQGMNKNIPNAYHASMDVVVQKIAKDVNKIKDVKPKLKLLLVGKQHNHIWNRGAVNRIKSKSLLGLLTPLMDDKEKEEMRERINKNGHVYREKPNRQENSNDKPSFWAVTGKSQPWCFLKQDPVGYSTFLNQTLTSYEKSQLPAEKHLFKTWKHLLTNAPSKERPEG